MLGTRRQLIRLTVKNSIICFSFSIARWQHLQTWVITVQLRVGDIAWYGYRDMPMCTLYRHQQHNGLITTQGF